MADNPMNEELVSGLEILFMRRASRELPILELLAGLIPPASEFLPANLISFGIELSISLT